MSGSMKKMRIDEALVRRGLAENRERALRLVMAGEVLVGDEPVDKPGSRIDPSLPIRLRAKKGRFVSRAGQKLEAALANFKISLQDLTAMDLGASTGGFTDCMLRAGARTVYAVDVGTNQLDYRLRTDPRVVSLERTHAKQLSAELVPEAIDFLAVDVSFTSLRYVLPHARPLLAENARSVCLLKPQFEAAREKVAPGGRVSAADADEVREHIEAWFQAQGIRVLGVVKSPIKGRQGNQEFLYWLAFGPIPA